MNKSRSSAESISEDTPESESLVLGERSSPDGMHFTASWKAEEKISFLVKSSVEIVEPIHSFIHSKASPNAAFCRCCLLLFFLSLSCFLLCPPKLAQLTNIYSWQKVMRRCPKASQQSTLTPVKRGYHSRIYLIHPWVRSKQIVNRFLDGSNLGVVRSTQVGSVGTLRPHKKSYCSTLLFISTFIIYFIYHLLFFLSNNKWWTYDKTIEVLFFLLFII